MDGRLNGKEHSRVKISETFGCENGEHSYKNPAAVNTPSNYSKNVLKCDGDINLRVNVVQLQDLTKCTEDEAVTALYDCENNLERAVELVLDKFGFDVKEEWHTTVSKKGKVKNTQETHVNGDLNPIKTESITTQKLEKRSDVSEKNSIPTQNEKNKNDAPIRNRIKRFSGRTKNFVQTKSRSQNVQKKPNSANTSKTRADSNVWDPYADCAQWEGEPIEIVNSNSSIAIGLQNTKDLSEDDIHEHDKDDGESMPESHTRSDSIQNLARNADAQDYDALFSKIVKTKTPPHAFNGYSDTSLFIAPEILDRSHCSWNPTFGGDSLQTIIKQVQEAQNDKVEIQPNVSNATHSSGELVDLSSKQFNFPSQIHRQNNSGFDMKTTPFNVVLDNECDEKSNSVTRDYHNRRFEDSPPKLSVSYNQKKQNTNIMNKMTNESSAYIEPTIKSYILDELSENIDKLGVNENGSQDQKQFSVHQPTPQSHQVTTSFNHSQSNSNGIQHPINKIQMHSSTPASNQPQSLSTSSQTHPQSSALPPGMPHFISQYAPPTYHMFNLPGNSNTGPALFDLDQLQLLQQQRILYDMHLQHQSATTTQSILPQNVDATTSAKSISHSLPTPVGHVTPANNGIRSDMLTPALGHTPQMVTPGHPYFSYPGFLVMNGYPNAFLNHQQQQQQQQSNSDNNQTQNSGHCGSPITQHQNQQTSQAYNTLKQINTGVNNYEDLLDNKYGDPAKQVGYKSNQNQNYNSFQSQSIGVDNVVANKLSSSNHSAGASLSHNFNHANNSNSQHFPPQFYPTSSPYLTAMAAAAVAAASVKQQSNNAIGNNQQSNTNPVAMNNQGNNGSGNGSNPMHLSGNNNQAMVLGGPGLHHHQRAPISHH